MTLRGENGEGLNSTQRLLRHLEMHLLLTVSHSSKHWSPSPRVNTRARDTYDLEDYCSHIHKGAKTCLVGTARDRVAGIRNVKLRV